MASDINQGQDPLTLPPPEVRAVLERKAQKYLDRNVEDPMKRRELEEALGLRAVSTD